MNRFVEKLNPGPSLNVLPFRRQQSAAGPDADAIRSVGACARRDKRNGRPEKFFTRLNGPESAVGARAMDHDISWRYGMVTCTDRRG